MTSYHSRRSLVMLLLSAAVFLLLSTSTAFASVEPRTLAQLAAEAKSIVSGEVVSMQSHWNQAHTLIVTDVRIRVSESVKGSASGEVLVEVPGGEADGFIADVADVPAFTVGEQVILFLRDQAFQVVGWHQGKFTVRDGIVLEWGIPVSLFLQNVRQIVEAQRLGRPMPPEGPSVPTMNTLAVAPMITSISPNSGPAKQSEFGSAGKGTCPNDATEITIQGSNFGATQGSSTVRFWRDSSTYYNACIISWSDTRIVARVPGSVSSGNVNVITPGGTSNGVAFTVTYSYGGARWAASNGQTTVNYLVNANTSDTDGELAAVQAAANTWSAAAGTSFTFQYQGTSTKTDSAYDGENAIVWVNRDTGSIATTWTWRHSSDVNRIIEFDIVFDDLDYTWHTDGGSGAMDVQNIATHELGHTLSLLDLYGTDVSPNDSAKTMYGHSSNGETQKRTLETDDIAGICYIYLNSCVPPTPPVPTQPPLSCPTDGREGIYFYKDRDYQGACFFSTNDISDFGSTPIGDNGLSSIIVVGSWEVTIYEDRAFDGRYDVLGHSDPNLDIRSLGGQYSSAKIASTTSSCPTDSRAGVYFYSNKDYGGRCTFSTSDISDFGQTAVGNDDLSSIRFIGDWEATIYEDVDFGGRHDVIGSDDPNLDIRSLGGQYSSVKIKTVVVQPTNTPPPSPTLAPYSVELLGPTTANGGFESGNMSGWTQSGGSFDIASDAPHSGRYYVKGTSSTEAFFYKDLNLDAYATSIDAGLSSAHFGAWTHNGNSEWYRFIVRYRNQAGGELGLFDTDWRHDGGSSYIHLVGSTPLIPQGSRSVRIEIHAKRTSGDYTDMDVDDVSFTLQYRNPPPTATSTSAPTYTSTATRTSTFVPTSTRTPTYTPTRTPTRAPTHTPSRTPTGAPVATFTRTPTYTPTRTPTRTTTYTPTHIPTGLPAATSTRTPTSTPTRTPTPMTGGFGISINGGASYTRISTVTLALTAPGAVAMYLNDVGGRFIDDQWRPFVPTTTWQLSSHGAYMLPRFVYAWFMDGQGNVIGPHFDGIVLDPVPPTGSITIQTRNGNNISLRLQADDDNSGVADMRLSEDPQLANGSWRPYSVTYDWTLRGEVIYVQYRDRAGNVSPVYGSDESQH